MPSGRGGLYYLLTYLDTVHLKFGTFFLAKFPRENLCIVDGDNSDVNDHDNVACAVTLYLNPGKIPVMEIKNHLQYAYVSYVKQ